MTLKTDEILKMTNLKLIIKALRAIEMRIGISRD